MIQFEVGKPFHLPNPSPGLEFPLVRFNATNFDICLYSTQAIADQKMITKESLKVYTYISQNVPFIIVEFKGYTFDCSLNILKVAASDAQNFVNSDSNILSLYLIDTFNNTLQGIRMLGLTVESEKIIKEALKKQMLAYETPMEVDSIITTIQNKLDTDEMIQRAKTKQIFVRN